MDDGRDRVADDRTTEVRFLAPAEQVALIDAIGMTRGMDRTQMMRTLLRDTVEKALHDATVLCRVARVNPLASDSDGKCGK